MPCKGTGRAIGKHIQINAVATTANPNNFTRESLALIEDTSLSGARELYPLIAVCEIGTHWGGSTRATILRNA
jgi:hypothetical protein